MAKKRKRGGPVPLARDETARNRGQNVSQDDASADSVAGKPGTCSRVKSGSFCLRSSLGAPFLVVSDKQLVGALSVPSPEEWKEILALCAAIIKSWDVRGAAVLSDFEGEMTGLEGELVSAAFQRTFALDPKSLRPLPSQGTNRDMGLLIDLRCAEGVALVKRIMESDTICKVIWGAAGDVTSLRYCPAQRPLGIQSACVVDAQLAFSSVGKRLAMATMLERLPDKSIAGLPEKGSIDFVTPHSHNCRALALPFEQDTALYAVDDLHRLDAVLQNKKPGSGSYMEARRQTLALHSSLLHSPSSSSAEVLAGYQTAFIQKSGVERQLAAVRAKRHILALRILAIPCESSKLSVIEAEANAVLSEAGVVVSNLSLYSSLSRRLEEQAEQDKARRKAKGKKGVKKKKKTTKSHEERKPDAVGRKTKGKKGMKKKKGTKKSNWERKPGAVVAGNGLKETSLQKNAAGQGSDSANDLSRRKKSKKKRLSKKHANKARVGATHKSDAVASSQGLKDSSAQNSGKKHAASSRKRAKKPSKKQSVATARAETPAASIPGGRKKSKKKMVTVSAPAKIPLAANLAASAAPESRKRKKRLPMKTSRKRAKRDL